MKILMVCLGNICRSPLAEGIMKQKISEAGLTWEVDSAGTLGHQIGCAPHHLSQKLARMHGFDISSQSCRRITSGDLDAFDKVYAMDIDNYNDIMRLAKKSGTEHKIDLLLNEFYPGKNISIPDPWYGGEEGYHEVYDMIEKACTAIIRKYGAQDTHMASKNNCLINVSYIRINETIATTRHPRL